MSLATREIYSPNYYRQGWIYGPPKVVFIHASRSGIEAHSYEQELASTINHFASLSSQASSHWIVSPTERVRMVPDEYPSWCTGYHNFEGYNIELTQPVARTPYQPGHYRNLALVCVPYALQGIPIVRVGYWAYGQDQPRGFVGHEDTQQGQSVGKSDPGPMFNWDEFLRELRYQVAPITEEDDDMILWRNPHAGKTQEIYIVAFAGKSGGGRYHVPNGVTFRALGLGKYTILNPKAPEFDGIKKRPWSAH